MSTPALSRLSCLVLALLGVFLLTSCSVYGDSPNAGRDNVLVQEVGDVIVIKNRRDAPIWANLYSTGYLISAFIAPPAFRGDSIPPGGSRTTPLDSIPGIRYTSLDPAGIDIQVLWFEAEVRDGERVPPDDYNTFRLER